MADVYQFFGSPQSFHPDQWDLLQQLLEREPQIEISVITDLPPPQDVERTVMNFLRRLGIRRPLDGESPSV